MSNATDHNDPMEEPSSVKADGSTPEVLVTDTAEHKAPEPGAEPGAAEHEAAEPGADPGATEPEAAEPGAEPGAAERPIGEAVEPSISGAEPGMVLCSACGEANLDRLSWCEACGHDLNAEPKPACTDCGEQAVEPDGYCHSCGHRQPVERDHVVATDGSVVAVTDRGQRHHHNEDAVAVAEIGDAAIIVVCDGVSSTPGSADVSAAAAEATARTLADGIAAGAGAYSPPLERAVSDDLLFQAVAAAQAASIEAAVGADADLDNPPSTTFVAAVARPDHASGAVAVSVAWLGDSRAYWLDEAAALLLTEDHEIAGALTRWLGPDAAADEPDVAHYRFPPVESSSIRMLLVCSDGLWRYFAPEIGEPAEILVARLGAGEGKAGLELAEALVAFANDSGGHDNISVGLWSDPADRSSGGETEHGEETGS